MNFCYKKWNNWVAWILSFIVFIVYLSTIELNFSFWDCGEYISSAAKLEITHSPGAAFFQIIGAVFSIFSFNNFINYGIIINSLSALYSALTILFLFWNISYLGFKILRKKNKDLSFFEKFNILSGALIGALTFSFTDTFWFSAVEGEVYAMSSCFIAMLLWMIFRFENCKNKEEEYRWILIIGLIIGLSVGVHMMVLLTIPSICFIYYIKKYSFTWKSFLITHIITLLIFGIIFKGFFSFIMLMFGKIEIFFINELGFPFHSGSIFCLIILFLFFLISIKLCNKYNFFKLNLIIHLFLFILIGFSCWLVIPIRANANPPMNLNNPNNAIGMLDYYNREQYGDWPVFYGENYTAHIAKDGFLKNENGIVTSIRGMNYEKNEKKHQYIKTKEKIQFEYNPKHKSFFPRMYHSDINVMENYGMMMGYPDFEIDLEYYNEPEIKEIVEDLIRKKENREISIQDYQKYNEFLNIKKPSNWQNFKFFIDYQLGFMFTRYLLWNYVGRQNDFEGQYSIHKGNWLSGFNWFDKNILKLGDQKLLPKRFKNKSTNYYYFIPFLFGIIGLFYHLNLDTKRFYALIILFILTSVGIIIYTNVRPFEPRERDYALVGSFYVFSIWIGLGSYFLMSLVQSKKSYFLSFSLFLIIIISIPCLLFYQNFDDHDRSKRKLAYDLAYSYLVPLDKNSILFTYGDNDTYPLWAIQEISNLRTDIKIINYSLLGTAWNIDQIKRKTYNSLSIPGIMKHEDYRDGKNDMVFVMDHNEINNWLKYLSSNQFNTSDFELIKKISNKKSMTAKEALDYLLQNNAIKNKFINTRYTSQDGEVNFLPVKKITIPVNKANVIKYKIVDPEDIHLIEDSITIDIKSSNFRKEMLSFLDLLANYNWDRPIYFSAGGSYLDSNLFFLSDYLQFEGFTYKFIPIKTPKQTLDNLGYINPNILVKNIKKFKWGNFKNLKIHYDDNSLQNTIIYRHTILRTVKEFLKKHQFIKAKSLLNLLEREIPLSVYPLNNAVSSLIYCYLILGENVKADKIYQEYIKNIFEEFDYYQGLEKKLKSSIQHEIIQLQIQYAKLISSIIEAYKNTNQKNKIEIFLRKSFYPLDKRFKYSLNKRDNFKNLSSLLKEYYGPIFQVLYKIDSNFIKSKFNEINNIK